MAHFLVASERHGLTPLAWRLQREGHQVDTLAFRPRYERAFAGALQSPLTGEARPARKADLPTVLAPYVEAVEAGTCTVLHDCDRWGQVFPSAQYPTHPWRRDGAPSTVRLGGWWDGHQVTCPHLLLEDRGAWPGGGGPQVAGALTVVRPRVWPTLFAEALSLYADEWKSVGHRGLVQVSASMSPTGELVANGWEGGWCRLHAHAFLAALGTDGVPLGAVLVGEAEPALAHRYAVVAPVTVPPWPNLCNIPSAEVALRGVDDAVARHLFLHDVRIDREARTLWVAGLDGLVAVARGCADSLELALGRLAQVAGAVQVPERQWRMDAGHTVREVLARLEAVGLSL